jgi:hypothetical protein
LTSISISRESMSTTVQMPVRVKPPPADTARSSRRLCVLGDDDAREGRADREIVEVLLREAEAPLGDGDVATPRVEPGLEGLDFGLRRIEIRLRGQLLLAQACASA